VAQFLPDQPWIAVDALQVAPVGNGYPQVIQMPFVSVNKLVFLQSLIS
jgi:hypothetical protein